jgi:hypothetical protein
MVLSTPGEFSVQAGESLAWLLEEEEEEEEKEEEL